MLLRNNLRKIIRKDLRKFMSTRKSYQKHIRNLTKLGGHSIGLTLPISIVRQLKWRERQKVTVKKVGKRLIVEDWKK